MHELLKALKQEGVHTAIETCGLFNYEQFCAHALPWLNVIYFDLKLVDEQKSREHTGCSNRVIFENFRRLAVQARPATLAARIPLIPGITTTEDNLAGLARFLRSQSVTHCTLLPYNPLFEGKLSRLARKQAYRHGTHMTQQEQERCARCVAAAGGMR